MQARGHHVYELLLKKVNPRHRAPVLDFVELGVIPDAYPRLMRVLSDPESASTPSDHAVVAFLAKHCPDVAYGDPAYLVRWERQGGLKGGKPR